MSDRLVTDAQVVDAVRDVAWTVTVNTQGGMCRKLTSEELYGRRKMTHLIRRTTLPKTSWGAVDRAMHPLRLQGVTRAKKVRTTVQDEAGKRAQDLLDRDFTAPRPNHTGVMEFTFVATWSRFVYVASYSMCTPQRPWGGMPVASGWFHQLISKPPTTQPKPLNCNQYKSGTEPAAIQGTIARGPDRLRSINTNSVAKSSTLTLESSIYPPL